MSTPAPFPVADRPTIRWPFFADPVIPFPDAAQVSVLVERHGKDAPRELQKIEHRRRELLRKRTEDPFHHGYVAPVWKRAEALLWESVFLVLFGANRSTKTWFAVWAAMRHMVRDPGASVLFLHNDANASIDVHQAIFWHYMPREWRPKSGKRLRTGSSKISYQEGDGFASDVVVFPNGSRARFGNFKQDWTRFEGAQYTLVSASEKFPLPLLETLGFRLPGAGKSLRMVWDYSPIHGIEPSIERVLTGAQTVESGRAVHLPVSHKGMPSQDWPAGDMPRLQQGATPGLRILYFWSEDNPMGAGEGLREKMRLEKWDLITIERRLYGFARNIIGKALPKFGKRNLAPLAELMKRGLVSVACTRRMVYDPAGGRNPFIAWFAVDAHSRHTLYREWPERARFGEWAQQSSDESKWNGDRGPAQEKIGLSVAEQKRMILESEGWLWDGVRYVMQDPAHPPEVVFERFIDPRAGAAQRQAENEDEGQTLIDIFAAEQADAAGNVIGPAMHFIPAPGFQEDHGLEVINTKYLGYNMDKPIEPLTNEPLFYVAEECENAIYSLLNYRARRPKLDDACKDPFDCVRYYFTAEPSYIPPGGFQAFGVKGGY